MAKVVGERRPLRHLLLLLLRGAPLQADAGFIAHFSAAFSGTQSVQRHNEWQWATVPHIIYLFMENGCHHAIHCGGL